MTAPSLVSAVALIPAANDQIRQIATAEGATLVDLYQGFNGNPDPYIGADGLHPTPAGYARIADIFFNGINAWLASGSTVFGANGFYEP